MTVDSSGSISGTGKCADNFVFDTSDSIRSMTVNTPVDTYQEGDYILDIIGFNDLSVTNRA